MSLSINRLQQIANAEDGRTTDMISERGGLPNWFTDGTIRAKRVMTNPNRGTRYVRRKDTGKGWQG